jgi:hypothetical protein
MRNGCAGATHAAWVDHLQTHTASAGYSRHTHLVCISSTARCSTGSADDHADDAFILSWGCGTGGWPDGD